MLPQLLDCCLCGVGRTPLHYAALHGRAAAVEELIKQGAAHGACDNRGGYTPLHLAADAGQCEVISRLFELGADLEAVSIKGWTPLALANMKVSAPFSLCRHNNKRHHVSNSFAKSALQSK